MDKFGLPRLGWLHVVKQEPMTVGNPRKPRCCRKLSLSSAWQGHTSRGTSFSHKAGQRQTRNNEPEMNRQTKEKLIDKFWPIEKSLIEPV
ncbi:Otoferlin [Trichinella spiralis]|uniref:Otoferlin n=1 Tax=Trichinella spiralis TaxID=6334 RepID=A0ABR3KW73_TRISP